MHACLVEKQLTTPQQYPLTLNALIAATNQATNRDPVFTLGEDAVPSALDDLRNCHLVRVVLPSHGRSVKRYRHVLDEAYGLDAPRYGLLAALILRGPQTVGELRARTERVLDIPSVGDGHDELTAMAEHPEGLVRLLSRRPGQKEGRWQQIVAAPWIPDGGLLGDDEGLRPQIDSTRAGEAGDGGGAYVRNDRSRSGEDEPGSSVGADHAPASDWHAELDALRSELESLQEEVHELREEFDAIRQGLGG